MERLVDFYLSKSTIDKGFPRGKQLLAGDFPDEQKGTSATPLYNRGDMSPPAKRLAPKKKKRGVATSVQQVVSKKKTGQSKGKEKKEDKGPTFPVPVGYVLPRVATKNLTKALVLRCIVGSGGIIARIAGNANTSYMQMYRWINKRREADEDIKAALDEEMSRMGDVAEITIRDAMMQRVDLNTASRTAQWYLAQQGQGRGYRSKQTVVHEGGNKPIGVEATRRIALEELSLDLETRKTVLQAVRAKRVKKKGKKS